MTRTNQSDSASRDAVEFVNHARDSAAILANIRAAADVVEQRQKAEEPAAIAAVDAHSANALLRDLGLGVRTNALARDAASARAKADKNLSASGIEAADQVADAAFDTASQRQRDSVLVPQSAKLLADFPGRRLPMMPADVAANASLFFVSADAQLPATLLSRLTEMLRVALDPATPAAEQLRQNQLLDSVGLPLCQRFASAPPRHWAAWSLVANELGNTIAAHLEVSLQQSRHRLATERVEAYRYQFESLVSRARVTRPWSDIPLNLGAPIFTPAS